MRILLALLLFGAPVRADNAPPDGEDASETQDDDDSAAIPEPTPEPTPALPPAANERLTTARILVDRLERLQSEVRVLTERRNREFDTEERSELNRELAALEEQLSDASADLQRLVTGLDMAWISEPPTDEFAIEDEIADLLSPILQELKSATERPRKIEQLRILIAHYEERLPRLGEAADDLDTLYSQAIAPPVQAAVKSVRADLLEQQRLLEEQLSIARHELTLLESQKKSLVESGADVARVFFRNRGRNLLFAFLALVSVFALVRITHRGLRAALGPENDDDATIFTRIADLTGYLTAVMGGISGMLLVLYASGDWVLLTLAGIVLIGLSLGARQGIPRVWEEVKLMLNLGTVRQGERVVYLGVPWRVASLNLLSVLENPAFPDAPLRLPIRQLLDLRSRPWAHDEPWFPCEDEDWVLLPDDVFGEVLTISPDFVQVRVEESTRTWPTADFLSLSPINLTQGYRHVVRVTFDYMHQADIVHGIPPALRAVLEGQLTSRVGDGLVSLEVEYESAAASSLDVRIDATFGPDLGPVWRDLRRAIEGAVIDACNEHGWEIALPQIVMHRPPGATTSSD